MKTSLQLKLSQHLALTPQLQQSIKLLQLSTVELNQELERFLLENPLLEREDGDGPEAFEDAPRASLEGNVAPKDAPDVDRAPQSQDGDKSPNAEANESAEPSEYEYDSADFSGGATSSRGEDDYSGDSFGDLAEEKSLQLYLLDQLRLMPLTPRDRQLTAFVVAHLDDDGYLSYGMDDLCELALGTDELSADLPDDEDPREAMLGDLGVAVRLVQNLEPAGVGARSLGECLSLQIAQHAHTNAATGIAARIVADHLDLLAGRDYVKLKRLLRLSDESLKAARDVIISLDPKPGRRFTPSETRYVVPDVVVRKVRGRWRAMLNQAAMPRLRVNQYYADLVHKSRDTDGKNLAGQLQEARWLIKNIQQRFDTILRVTEAIVENQRHFFDHGEVAMRPLVLREIADQVGLHESTVSRVTTQKYMLTPRGIFELKYFFGSSVATEAGGACSATAIRALIKQLVEAEDSRKPLSDNKIADLLSDQGILVARRTVAKYRESLQIHPANLRKSI
jgi:RNA polymerase sigma-54 factor